MRIRHLLITTFLLLTAGTENAVWAKPLVAWKSVTADNIDKRARLGTYRDSNDALHIAWRHEKSSGVNDLYYRKLNSAGKFDSAAEVASAGWGLASNPDVLVDNAGQVSIYFGGLTTETVSYNGKLGAVRKAGDGAPWVLDAEPIGQYQGASTASAIRSLFDNSGRAIHAYTSSDIFVFVEGEGEKTFDLECCIYNGNVAIDAVSGNVVMGWYSLDNVPGYKQSVQALLPTVGDLQKRPVLGHGDGPIPITARPGFEGVYTAYCVGRVLKSICRFVQVEQYGSGNGSRIPNSRDAKPETLSLTAGAGGVMWSAWAGESELMLSRSKSISPKFKNPVRLPAPQADATVYSTELVAYADGVDVFVIAQSGAKVGAYHTRISRRTYSKLRQQL